MLQLVYALSELVRAIALGYGTAGLQYDAAIIVHLINIVYADARFFIACCYHSIVYTRAIHALATIAGQQCGVYVDDAVGVLRNKRTRYLP